MCILLRLLIKNENHKKQQTMWIFLTPLLLLGLATRCTVDGNNSRSLQECTISELSTFEGLWIFDFSGKPGLWTAQDSEVVENAIMADYACSENGAFHELTNVSLRLDLIPAPDGYEATRSFPLPVSIEGATNLIDWDDRDQLFDDDRRRLEQGGSGTEMNLRRGLEDCGCSDTIHKDEFLGRLTKRLSPLLMNVDNVTYVFETEEEECEPEVTPFSSNIAMEIVGKLDLVNTGGLAILATSVVSVYNNLNVLSGGTCDVLFRTVRAGSAIVDPFSIRRGEGSGVTYKT
jgi:hypothetical protein